MHNFDGYIFDLDGTLAFSQHFHYEAYARVLEEEGIRYTREDDIGLYQGQGSEKIFPTIFRNHGRDITTEKAHELIERKRAVYDQLIEQTPIKPVPGVTEYLEILSERGVKKIVATGNRRAATKVILEKTNLQKFFTKEVTIDDVKEAKPSPETFLLAANELHVEPSACIIFEDAVSGVQAAKASGSYCVGISTGTEPERLQAAGADKVMEDFRPLIQQ